MDLSSASNLGTRGEPARDVAIRAEGEREGPRSRARKQVDLMDAVRVAGVPVSLGATAWTGLPWWFVGVMALYSVASGPVQDFLYTVLSAAADRWANRIRAGPGDGLDSQNS